MRRIAFYTIIRIILGVHFLAGMGFVCNVIAADTFYNSPSILSVDISSDTESTANNSSVDINYALDTGDRLSAGYGVNQQVRNTSQGIFEPTYYFLSYLSQLEDSVDIRFNYEGWGEENKLTAQSIGIDLGFEGDEWNFSVNVESRDIVWTPGINRQCVPSANTVKLDSNAVGVQAGYSGLNALYLSAQYKKYDYSRDMSKLSALSSALATICISNGVSDNAQQRIKNFNQYLVARSWLFNIADDNETNLRIVYQFETLSVGVDWIRYQSAVDNSLTYYSTFFFSIDFLDDWSFRLSASQQNASGQLSTDYAGGGLSYYW